MISQLKMTMTMAIKVNILRSTVLHIVVDLCSEAPLLNLKSDLLTTFCPVQYSKISRTIQLPKSPEVFNLDATWMPRLIMVQLQWHSARVIMARPTPQLFHKDYNMLVLLQGRTTLFCSGAMAPWTFHLDDRFVESNIVRRKTVSYQAGSDDDEDVENHDGNDNDLLV